MPSLPRPAWRALILALGHLPQGAMSRVAGRFADLRIPVGLRRPVLAAFARAVGIDVDEAENAIAAYPSINALFCRRLRPGARPWRAEPSGAGSPVDAVIGQVGRVAGGRVLQAKGRAYSAAELLDDAEEAERFEGGAFATFYLSPRHYHRIHAPCGGLIPLAHHVPGALLPVNAAAVESIPDLFARNERIVAYLDGPLGRVAVVAIGATHVGRISTEFDPEWSAPEGAAWVTNRPGGAAETRRYDPPRPIHAGDELMAFHLGSSVVVLLEPGRAELDPGVVPRREIRVGAPLAHAGG
ncbi:MAG TPA: archaetidylserine decarboxylase [Gemmatimonadota bacterium]|nr:archaetidylserine decarboxylase [Gemmatimonadota bacterium]